MENGISIIGRLLLVVLACLLLAPSNALVQGAALAALIGLLIFNIRKTSV